MLRFTHPPPQTARARGALADSVFASLTLCYVYNHTGVWLRFTRPPPQTAHARLRALAGASALLLIVGASYAWAVAHALVACGVGLVNQTSVFPSCIRR